MALTETMVIQAANEPMTINNMNNEWGSFGWSVLNIQVTHSQDSRTYTKGLDYLTGDLTVETTTINYATITYQRDRKFPNRDQIVEYEREYIRLRQELAGEVARIEKEERDKQLSGFNITYKDQMLHPLKSMKKSWGSLFSLGKELMGMDTRSSATIQRSNELTREYAARLEAIREKAEELL